MQNGNRGKGCLQLAVAFTVFFVIMNLIGVTDVSWLLLMWWLWLPIAIVFLIIIWM